MHVRALLLVPTALVLFLGITGSIGARAVNVVSGPASVRFKYNLALDTPPFLVQDLVWNCAPWAPHPDGYLWMSNTGILQGSCFYDPDPGNPYVDRVSASMNGNINLATGEVTYNSTSTFKEARHTQTTGSVSHTVDLQGTGTASGTYASGTVQYTVTSSCEPTPMCDPNSTYSYSGEVPFELIITPVGNADVRVDAVDVIQVVQDDLGTVPLAAERATVARLYLQSLSHLPDVKVILTMNEGNNPVPGTATLLPGSALTPLTTPDRSITAGSFNFLLPTAWTTPGLKTLKVKVELPAGVTETTPADNEFELPVLFEEKRRLTVGYMPVCVYTDDIDNPVCPGGEYPTADAFADAIFPSPGGVRSVQFPMPPHTWKYDPAVDPIGASLIAELRSIYDVEAMLSLEEVPDQLAGWIPPIGGEMPGGLSDPVWAGSTGRVSFSQSYTDLPEYSTFLLAHEVAHNLGRRHTNRNDSCGAQDPDSDWLPQYSITGSYGWDIRRNVVVPPDRNDLMTYCAQPLVGMWISPFTYMHIFDGDWAPRTATTSRALLPYLVISGMAMADGSSGLLKSAYTVQSATAPEAHDHLGGHTHCLRFNNTPANDFCFELEFEDHKTHQPLDRAWFSVVAPLPASTTKVALMVGSIELATLTTTANQPEVTFSGFPIGATWDGDQSIAWNATDDDGGELRSLVLYTRDGGTNWHPLALNLTGSSFAFDTDTLLPGLVQFKMLTTDGLNVDEALSPPVTVLGVSGDVTCDGTIEVDDAIAVKRSLASLEHGAVCIAAADVNCSGQPEATDALALLRTLAGLPVTLPQGCTAIGSD